MTYSDFIEIVEKTKKDKPILFELESDKLASLEDIQIFESETGIILPEEYKKFLSEFGGGYFGFATIYSLDKDSSFYLLDNQKYIPDNYLAISDNGCGDVYIMKKLDGNISSEIFFYDHETGNVSDKEYENIYEFLVSVGLRK